MAASCTRRNIRAAGLGLTVILGAVGLGLWLAGCRPRDLDTLRAQIRADFPDVRFVDTADLAARPAGTVILLDERSPQEFAVSHLPGAVRAEADPVAQLQALGATPDTPVVVYCSVGVRSARLARKLKAAGFQAVDNLDGSIFTWAAEGRPLVNAAGPTGRVHPYDHRWGRYLARDRWAWEP